MSHIFIKDNSGKKKLTAKSALITRAGAHTENELLTGSNCNLLKKTGHVSWDHHCIARA